MRNLFENKSGEIYEYTDEQVSAGYGSKMRRLDKDEACEHISKNSAESFAAESKEQ